VPDLMVIGTTLAPVRMIVHRLCVPSGINVVEALAQFEMLRTMSKIGSWLPSVRMYVIEGESLVCAAE